MTDSTLREQIASMFTEEGEHFENKLDRIEALIALKVQEARIDSLLDLEQWIKLHDLEKDMIMDGIEHMVNSLIQVPAQRHQNHAKRLAELAALHKIKGENE